MRPDKQVYFHEGYSIVIHEKKRIKYEENQKIGNYNISYVKEDGTVDTTRRAWHTDNVQFGYEKEGTTFWVQPIEYSQRATRNAFCTLVNGIAIQKYTEDNPPTMVTMAKGIIFPAWNNSHRSLIFQTTQ
jgi:hypothetical protein